MIKNTYQILKEEITSRLEKRPKPLQENEIENTIKTFKKMQESNEGRALLSDLYFNVYDDIESLQVLDDTQWGRMVKELETSFDVKTTLGIIVTGKEQKERDNEWWSVFLKGTKKNYYSNNYKKIMSKSLTKNVVKNIDEDMDIVMNCLGNPKEEEFERYGMVVGNVQAGKTANYSSLICKAADAGYKFIVVIAGSMDNLREQTQERLNLTFIGRDIDKNIGVASLSDYREDKRPISLTSRLKDFNKEEADRNAQGVSLDSTSSPVIIITKKNTKTLNNIYQWIKTHYPNGVENHAMLLIDDESDYASINTKAEEDPTKTNELIRSLLKLFKKSSYVAFTATPYANIFIDHNTDNETLGKDLFPEDFIYCLNAPSNYFGSEKIFLDKKRKYFYDVDDFQSTLPFTHKKEHSLFDIPESLKDAIRLFVINIAVRNLREQENSHNSMLVHASRFKNVHGKIAKHVKEYYEDLKDSLIVDGKKNNSSTKNNFIGAIKTTFDKHYEDYLEFDWDLIIKKVVDILDSVKIIEVHSGVKEKLKYQKDSPMNVIVIGGTSLARGYTLEGLSVSYFLRNTIFYDTLMQMGRWFGYRTEYEDLCKIYTTEDIFKRFKTITEATLDLIDDLQQMNINKMTPRDFGLSVKQHPDSGLQVTAKNKLKNSESIYFEMKLDGHLKETSWILKEEESNKKNLEYIRNLIKKIIDSKYIESKKRYWTDIPKDLVSNFVNDFIMYEPSADDFGIKSKMPIKFVKEYIKQENTLWDVAIYSGNSNKSLNIEGVDGSYQERKVTEKEKFYEVEHRQVSSGNAESIAISLEEFTKIKELKRINKQQRETTKNENGNNELEIYNVRKAIRNKMKKPLLMLHIIDAEITNNENDTSPRIELAAFGISFPGGIVTTSRNVKLQVNTVFLQNLQTMLEDEEYDD